MLVFTCIRYYHWPSAYRKLETCLKIRICEHKLYMEIRFKNIYCLEVGSFNAMQFLF